MRISKFIWILVAVLSTAIFISACGGDSAKSQSANASTSLTPGDNYLCLMHPEIKSGSEGKCPKCDMNLVPKSDYPTEGDAYTCSMHPEVTSGTPAKCTKCAMTLEPKNLSSSSQPTVHSENGRAEHEEDGHVY